MVKDINTGISSSYVTQDIVALNNKAYFFANNGTSTQLWKSDGTLAGTTMVKEISFPNQSAIEYESLGIAGNYIVFAINIVYLSAPSSRQLWRSDGTAAGTVFLSNIDQTTPSIIQFGNKVIFHNNIKLRF